MEAIFFFNYRIEETQAVHIPRWKKYKDPPLKSLI